MPTITTIKSCVKVLEYTIILQVLVALGSLRCRIGTSRTRKKWFFFSSMLPRWPTNQQIIYFSLPKSWIPMNAWNFPSLGISFHAHTLSWQLRSRQKENRTNQPNRSRAMIERTRGNFFLWNEHIFNDIILYYNNNMINMRKTRLFL